MNREIKLLKNTMILSVGTLLPKVASFITLPILTGYLTQEEFGTYDLVTVLVSLFLPTLTLQIQTAAFRFLVDAKNDQVETKGIISTILIFIVFVSMAALLLLMFVLTGIDLRFKTIIALYFFADTLLNTFLQILRGMSYNIYYAVSAAVDTFGKMVLMVIFVFFFRMGLMGALIALCMSSFLSLTYLLLQTKIIHYIEFRAFSLERLKKLIAYSWPMVSNGVSMWVMTFSDRLVITVVLGVTANAVYSAAYKIPSLLTVAQNTFSMAWQENASIAVKDSDANEYYSSMFKVMYDLAAGLMGILIATTPFIFKLLIHGAYGQAYNHIPILFMAMFFFTMSSYLGGIYVAHKATKSVGFTTTMAAIVNLVVNILLIRQIGLYAASVSTLISYFTLFIYRIINIRKIIDIKYSYKHITVVGTVMLIECAFGFVQLPLANIANGFISLLTFVVLNRKIIAKVICGY